MYKYFCCCLLALLPALLFAQAIPIHSARQQPPGATVTVRGRITNGAELGRIRYFQDGTAGLAAYAGTGSVPNFETIAGPGDSMEITGVLVDYQGLLEINPVLSFSMIAENLPLPAPRMLTLSDWNESFESQLIGVECVAFASGGGTFDSGVYNVTDVNGVSANVYLASGHPLDGDAIPGEPVLLTGILSDFSGLQLLPRTTADFSPAFCYYFTDQPSQTDISTNSFTLHWATNYSGTATILYGSTPNLGASITVPVSQNQHSFNLTGLTPGTVYWVQILATSNGNTIYSKSVPFATQSTSSGTIQVYFTRSIDPAFANGYMADGQSSAAVVAATIARINAAQQTIDVAMYNNNRSDLTNALKEAHARGVQVRYVAAADASNNALVNPPPFPVLYGNAEAIMHDKFLVIDEASPENAWVMSGSLNWTNQNINNDFNNTLFIQDQSLARAYAIEFEEMWGSETAQPNAQNSRFGAAKRDNTPHDFLVDGKPVSLWFSPSDRTTDRIVSTVYEAEEEALFATFSFTKNEIGDALADVFENGRSVRGMIENISDVGVEIGFLNSVGIDCRPHAISGDLHHKYGVFDANGTDPVVLTGSHNWSFAAETVNDENTLILHHPRLASLFKAEFEKRWSELTVGVRQPEEHVAVVSPNPTSEMLQIQAFQSAIVHVKVLDVLGREVITVWPDDRSETVQILVSNLKSGSYIALIQTQDAVGAVPFQKI